MQSARMGRFWPDWQWSADGLRLAQPTWQVGFLLMWLFVGLVSAYDAWLVVRYWDSILQLEKNPICVYFIRLGNGRSDIFLRVKTSGTLTVLSVLAGLYRNDRRVGWTVTGALSGFQLGLLAYLTFR